jgi:hypothetical protein
MPTEGQDVSGMGFGSGCKGAVKEYVGRSLLVVQASRLHYREI